MSVKLFSIFAANYGMTNTKFVPFYKDIVNSIDIDLLNISMAKVTV